jgi:hypothetical protein
MKFAKQKPNEVIFLYLRDPVRNAIVVFGKLEMHVIYNYSKKIKRKI